MRLTIPSPFKNLVLPNAANFIYTESNIDLKRLYGKVMFRHQYAYDMGSSNQPETTETTSDEHTHSCDYLPKSGGTMTGNTLTTAIPTDPTHLTTQKHSDNASIRKTGTIDGDRLPQTL